MSIAILRQRCAQIKCEFLILHLSNARFGRSIDGAMKKLLLIVLGFSLAVNGLALSAYDEGLLAGEGYPIAWADEVGFLTKQELTETAEVQAYHALQGHLIKKKDYDQFVTGWLEGFLSLHAKTIRDH
jgi:hypothetical protein